MKAFEFVKKFGLGDAKSALGHACGNLDHVAYNGYGLLISDLKQIVDAWELVESKGGLVECKKILSRDNFTWCSGGRVYVNPLERAVKIVEQCQ